MIKNRLLLNVIFYGLMVTSIYAEVTLDGTMGTFGNVKGPNYEINQGYGITKDTNLFHSFGKFNVDTNETANFKVSSSIQNIISRITGGERSWIDGNIKSTISDTSSLSNANLYLLNPSGILFGPNASLDMGGSFHVTTADYLRMGENDRFYVNDESPILTSEPPSAFGFLGNNPEKITFQGNGKVSDSSPRGLTAKDGKTVSVVAGDVDFNGTYYYDVINSENKALGNLAAPQGRINIASVASSGEVVSTDSGLDVSSFRKLGNVTMSDYSLLKVSGEGSGTICIRGENFYMKESSSVEADTTGAKSGGVVDIQVSKFNMDSSNIFSDSQATGNGGDIKINATDETNISNFSYIYANASGSGSKDSQGGKVYIESPKISIKDSSKIYTETYGKSKGGSVTLKAPQISVYDSEIFAGTEDEGDAGSVNLFGSIIGIDNNSIISSDTYYGKGKGGDVTISGSDDKYAESIDVSNSSSIYSGAIKGEFANASSGGKVRLKSKNINFSTSGKIGSESEGGGRGGDVSIEASESITFSGTGSSVYTNANSEASYAGNAGDIFIKAPKVNFKEKGGATASTKGPGNAGFIQVDADELSLDTQSAVTSKSDSKTAGGNAGKIDIKANKGITIKNGASVSTATEGGGNAGMISLAADNLKMESEAAISSSSNSKGTGGNAGQIAIKTDKDIELQTRALISTATEGTGNAGMISLEADNLKMQTQAAISSSSNSKGAGGNAGKIEIKLKNNLSMQDKGTAVTTSSYGQGNAGNITLSSNNLTLEKDAAISSESKSSTAGGAAGWITVNSKNEVRISSGGSITTEAINTSSSKERNDRFNGKITVNTKSLLYLVNSKITTSVKSGDGNGGDIEIDPQFVIMDHSKIIANAYEGNGGNIHIVSDQFIQDIYSIVDASSEFGLDGNIKIEAPDVDLSSALVILPSNFMDATQWVKTPCSARSAENISKFVFTSRDGMPTPYDDLKVGHESYTEDCSCKKKKEGEK
ncbi:MAG: filamentous hemagglutinin N-terminal domain-containing protein [Desulfobacterales bacterium]|nr:filamentous hemagglutinin N-terminal domain-containing protein [Desulfobacterales bacterium]